MASSSKDTTHKRKTTNDTAAAGKKKRRLSKKKNSTELLEALRILDPKLLVEEIRSDVVEYFTSEDLRTFIGKLFEEDEPMLKIAKLHRDSFAMLYSECKQPKNSFMEFQLRWHSYCSALLLEEKYTLEEINLKEADNGYYSLVAVRRIWLEFCKKHNTAVPTSNPVMIAISSGVYHYLLDQVLSYQTSFVDRACMEESPIISSDDDDVYFRFGSAALCSMLKRRYNEIKHCSSNVRNALSIEISMLHAMKTKNKSSIPAYLNYRDKGFMYFIHSSFIPFLRNFDGELKEVVNDKGFCKHGDNLIKVCKFHVIH